MFAKKIIAVTLGVLIFASFSPSLVFGQTTSPTITSKAQGLKVSNWCAQILPKINNRILSSQAKLTKRQAWAVAIKQKIQNKINKLNANGEDSTKASADLLTFSGMVDKWLLDYKVYGEDLQALKQFSCGNSHGDFKKAMKKTNDQIKIVNQDKEVFKNFWATTLSKDFQVQNQLKFNNKLNKLKTATPSVVQ
ncbi:hypothetical protein C4559_02430 [Candidatus Microgenomates bacterium]|nr:MAG: hypothetical protein C4559_02430 [Candidatus Microgenomates bacterium]